jgi:polyhydroxyalkanoate synthesis repressor PhaR
MQQESGAPGIVTVTIKKYANRRLYDTSSRRYVNLEDLATMIRKGRELRVIDAQSGEDLTRVILTQIIVEDAKGRPTGLPLELLRQLIVASDRAGQEFIMWYLKSAFDTYQKVQDSVQSRLSDVRDAALSPLAMVRNLLSAQPPDRATGEVEELRRRVAELEARLAHPPAPRKRASRTKS